MADNNATAGTIDDEDVDELTPGYKPPAPKTLEDIKALDQDDDALQKYKATLAPSEEGIKEADEGPDTNNVLVKQLAIKIQGRDDMKIDLTGDLKKLKEKSIIIKEGSEYRVEITFRVQRDIVSGLRYKQVTYKKGIKVDKSSNMVGSYSPKIAAHVYTTAAEEAPSGMIARGKYHVKSVFTDDDKNIYLKWEWWFEIKKGWE